MAYYNRDVNGEEFGAQHFTYNNSKFADVMFDHLNNTNFRGIVVRILIPGSDITVIWQYASSYCGIQGPEQALLILQYWCRPTLPGPQMGGYSTDDVKVCIAHFVLGPYSI